MPPREWLVRLEDILEAISKVASYTSGLDLAAFKGDERTRDAVVWNPTNIERWIEQGAEDALRALSSVRM